MMRKKAFRIGHGWWILVCVGLLLSFLIYTAYAQEPLGKALIEFPQDEGNHPAFDVEWWYLNFHEEGRAWWLAVARYQTIAYLLVGLTDLNTGEYESGYYLGNLQAVQGELDLSFIALNSDVHWYQKEGQPFVYHLEVTTPILAVTKELSSTKETLLEGGDGLVPISPGIESYYYSLTRLREPATASMGWSDHQWFNLIDQFPQRLPDHEWFSIQLDNGVEIVCWKIWTTNGIYRNFDLIDETNDLYHTEDFELTAIQTWRDYGSRWRLVEPARQIDLTIQTTVPDQLFTTGASALEFYEGATVISGTIGTDLVSGVGFAELTHTHLQQVYLPIILN